MTNILYTYHCDYHCHFPILTLKAYLTKIYHCPVVYSISICKKNSVSFFSFFFPKINCLKYYLFYVDLWAKGYTMSITFLAYAIYPLLFTMIMTFLNSLIHFFFHYLIGLQGIDTLYSYIHIHILGMGTSCKHKRLCNAF